MKRRLIAAAAIITVFGALIGPLVHAGRNVTIHVTGGAGVGTKVFVRGVDRTSQIVLVEDLEICTPQTLFVDTDIPFVLIIKSERFKTLLVDWQYATGDFSTSPNVPDPTNCGNGVVDISEACDTSNNLGCSPTSSTPVCEACRKCSCGSDSDCPQVTLVQRPCGYGRCAADERPDWRRLCNGGTCMMKYDCAQDLNCLNVSCVPDFDRQQECSAACIGPSERCHYNDQTACWACLMEPVIDSCASAEETNCQLDPALIGPAAQSGTEDDGTEVLDQLGLDGLTEEDLELVFDLLGYFDPDDNITFSGASSLDWNEEYAFDAWNVYRGNLGELLASGLYTQPLGDPLVDRFCGLSTSGFDDGLTPPPNEVVFYLLTTESSGFETFLGADSSGSERPNDTPCP